MGVYSVNLTLLKLSMRDFFTDKFNSMWHVILGVLAAFCSLIVPFFIIYQYATFNENLRVDLSEFFIGFIACISLIKLKVIPDVKLL